ncbi:MAG TPA: amylo-alpha-1,6-glucosidase [Candidatus Paceibacterota bacterium]|nr:amylo-alpha-1,6-glucosidase [Candidatus Paceibacterota bacterium]
MSPSPGEGVLRFVGDRICFSLRPASGLSEPNAYRAFLRTTLGRLPALLSEQVEQQPRLLRGQAWSDLAMTRYEDGWRLDLPLIEVGFFEAKAYVVDAQGRQEWPDGPNVGVSVHPNDYRTRNTIYCAFPRMFGQTKERLSTRSDWRDVQLTELDRLQYAVIPPSGKLRDLTRQVGHIMDDLGCRILHLLPINPTPTTFARMGRFGSPYACLRLTGIDLALVEFDRRTTAVDQFRELAYAVRAKDGRLFLDLAINHTGWGSDLHEDHPEWYQRTPEGTFVSPGAWGVIWEDLCELNHQHQALWQYLAEVFLVWCRRGVDGFRCDAGYKVPMQAWRFITARVRREFPETIFLLEGLGGAWADTERLVTEGGMQWAYSELFQNYSGRDIANYLDYCLRQNERQGLWVHYSETHDNDRLAKKGKAWSLLRNRLCALTSASGAFGFTCGVEWLAQEKINVHESRGLAWGNRENLMTELAAINQLLATHPCFFDHAKIQRLSPPDSPVYVLQRVSAEGKDSVLVLINTDPDHAQTFNLSEKSYAEMGRPKADLFGQASPALQAAPAGQVSILLPPAAVFCLSATTLPRGLAGEPYRVARAQAAWALETIHQVLPVENIGPFDWPGLAELAAQDPRRFLAALNQLQPDPARADLLKALQAAINEVRYVPVVDWTMLDANRITLIPPDHWLLIHESVHFRGQLSFANQEYPHQFRSIPLPRGHCACISPKQFRQLARNAPGDAELHLERYQPKETEIHGRIRLLPRIPSIPAGHRPGVSDPPLSSRRPPIPPPDSTVLLTNGLGGMAQLRVNLGSVQSKYDCLLGANLHPKWPVDRHVFAKRVRVWVNADGFLSPLNGDNLFAFHSGPPASWQFLASAGDGRALEVALTIEMLAESNTTVLRFHRPSSPPPLGSPLPPGCDVRLTVRIDIEDRNFHQETHRNADAELHFASHCRPLASPQGFLFTPAADRRLKVWADAGSYHHESEWSTAIYHPIEASRGQIAHSDAFSPGWFELPLAEDQRVTLVVTADPMEPTLPANPPGTTRQEINKPSREHPTKPPQEDEFESQLIHALEAFIVRRDNNKTVIAGYPWFLDWGRDTLICARGLLTAGRRDEVRQMLAAFGQLEQRGTLPNSLHGSDTSNRDTSDAPLWFALACEETAALESPEAPGQASCYQMSVDNRGRSVLDVLRSIAIHYQNGTPNGIRMDPASGLIWSPSHFTWMDTQHPAGTPREGYPIEIQALWIRLLRQLDRLGVPAKEHPWAACAKQALASLKSLFWLEKQGYWADVVQARSGQSAFQGAADSALRPNFLFAISLGLLSGPKACQGIEAAARYLVVPGALRSLAPLPAHCPRPILSADGRLLNNPQWPYWGRYEGDEDTRRKPAYHNGTAWTWVLPVFCEAMARAWESQPEALHAARAYLLSTRGLLQTQCQGQIPEVLDGDAPHQPRGCDAQAWSASENLRVWRLLKGL